MPRAGPNRGVRWHTGFITTTTPGIQFSEKDVQSPQYRVVLLDDDDHSYDYVIEMLQKIFIFTAEQALQHAQEVDATGRTVLITCELPRPNSPAIRFTPMAATGACRAPRAPCPRSWSLPDLYPSDLYRSDLYRSESSG